MSKPEDKKKADTPDLEAYSHLETAVEATIARVEGLQADLEKAKSQASDMEGLLRKFTDGEESPTHLIARLQRLEEENKVLLERLQGGRDGVERLLARIRFLEEQG